MRPCVSTDGEGEGGGDGEGEGEGDGTPSPDSPLLKLAEEVPDVFRLFVLPRLAGHAR